MDELYGMPLDLLWQQGLHLGIIGIEVESDDVFTALPLFDTHAANAGAAQQFRRMPALYLANFFFGGHRLPQISLALFQASVTFRACNTSAMWFAMVWLLEPAKSKPTALLVPRWRINEPESPALLNG